MLVNITEHFIESGREWQVGQNPDVPREVAAMWIADGKATADTDGVRNQSPVSGDSNVTRDDVTAATANADALNALLAAGQAVTLNTPGIIWLSKPIRLRADRSVWPLHLPKSSRPSWPSARPCVSR